MQALQETACNRCQDEQVHLRDVACLPAMQYEDRSGQSCLGAGSKEGLLIAKQSVDFCGRLRPFLPLDR